MLLTHRTLHRSPPLGPLSLRGALVEHSLPACWPGAGEDWRAGDYVGWGYDFKPTLRPDLFCEEVGLCCTVLQLRARGSAAKAMQHSLCCPGPSSESIPAWSRGSRAILS